MKESRDITEMAVIGSLLIDPVRVLSECREFGVNESWFINQKTRGLFGVLIGLAGDPQRIDLYQIGQKVRAIGQPELEPVAEQAVISTVTDSHSRYYLEDLRSYWLRDSIRFVTNAAAERAGDLENDPAQVLSDLQRDVAALTPSSSRRPVAKVYDDIIERWKSAATVGQIGLPSRWERVNALLGGYRAGKVYIIAANPSNGKTTFACNEALNLSRLGNRVAIASLEMCEDELRGRMLCEEAMVSSFALDTGRWAGHHAERIEPLVQKHVGLPITVSDESMTVERACAWATNEVLTNGAKIVFIDYLQILSDSSRQRRSSRNEEVSAWMNLIRETAKRINVPIVLLSQLSRANEAENRRPKLSDLRDSGSIEQAAYGVLFLHREDRTKESCEVIIAKNRGGPLGVVPMTFEMNLQRFVECRRVA